ncbi:serine hydrolase [Halobacillus sp. SY10]|uniref:D-alanyl-D-alanine carboxypeptidase n=1 Tax=Halobacillus trueperi TaxID=156205 RepID=A0A3D8VPR9_9BACI|nr:serine hydrolase [Halobacillus trueperi]RDY71380.1 D-alanyl-D-alanine carboxypeptidase [Halobacillus trueperi]
MTDQFIPIGVAIALTAIVLWKIFYNNFDMVINYAEKRREKDDISLIIKRNDEPTISINPHTVLPLASTMKIIIAIVFARQVSDNIIDENAWIPKEELLKFYMEGTDGGAHKQWVRANSDKDQYTLKEIAIGMIAYSSNANTEFLMNYLGLEAINLLPASLHMKSHTPIFPIVSSLYIPSYIETKEKVTDKNDLLKRLEGMSREEYIDCSLEIHEHLAANEQRGYMDEVKLDVEFQKIWSDRLPAASAQDYLTLMQVINRRGTFDDKMQRCIEEILGYALYIHPANRKWIEHGGMKGGSTLFVFTHASYTTDKEGNQTEVVFLANNLNVLNSRKLQRNFNSFLLHLLTNKEFRKKISS